MKRTLRLFLFCCAWISTAFGVVGVFVPVLPTTPLILLGTFLFAKSSPRCHAWITSTRIYRKYVVPFKDSGGLSLLAKIRILAISYSVMGLSATFVRKPLVWIILACVSLFLLYLMTIRIPTLPKTAIKEKARVLDDNSCPENL